jgi:hypothetical protein
MMAEMETAASFEMILPTYQIARRQSKYNVTVAAKFNMVLTRLSSERVIRFSHACLIEIDILMLSKRLYLHLPNFFPVRFLDVLYTALRVYLS